MSARTGVHVGLSWRSDQVSLPGQIHRFGVRLPMAYIDKQGKTHTTIRIDWVELKEKTLIFTELKLITDPRLTSGKGESEIISIHEFMEILSNGKTNLRALAKTHTCVVILTYVRWPFHVGALTKTHSLPDHNLIHLFDFFR